jgi:hypothetical protein
MRREPDIASLPLFPSEAQIAELVVGRERAKDWPMIAQSLEKRGFPKIDTLHGGRKLKDVLAWYDDPTRATSQGNLPSSTPRVTIAPYAEDGREDFHAQTPSADRRRAASRDRRARA